MDNKKIFSSLISFAVAILIFTATIFAWITLQEQASVDDFVLNVNDIKSEITLEVSKNGGDFVPLITEEDFNQILNDALPSNSFLFRLTITNKSSRATKIKVVLQDIRNINPLHDGFDMRDVFYIQDGIISVDGINTTPWNESLIPYNINALLVNNNILLIDNHNLEIDEDVIIQFGLVYDENTSAIEYQDGKLNIGAIYIYNN